MPVKRGLAVLLLAAALGAGAPPAAAAGTLRVFAAASLTEAFTALGRAFEAAHPGVEVQFNFAGSQQLAAQITEGAPADLFASADERWMGKLGDAGLLATPAQLFARNRLVVILPAANPAGLGRLQDLARPGLKLVLAADTVPVGRYSRRLLHKLAPLPGFGADFSARVLGNVVSEEENVKGVVAKVELGEADAGIVYRTDVTPAAAAKLRLLRIPDAFNVTADYPLAVLRDAAHPAEARAFLDFVLSPAGQQLLAERGFLPATTTEGR